MRDLRFRTRAAALVACCAIVLAACGGSDPAPTAVAPPKPAPAPGPVQEEVDPRLGGTLIVSQPGEPTSIYPFRFGAVVDWNVITSIYDSLVEFDLNDYSIVPALAESWTTSSDGKTWEFKLRPGVVFTNGESLNAQHVIRSMEQAQDPAYGRTAPLLTAVTSVTAVDAGTVRITLSKPERPLLSTLVDVAILPTGPTLESLAEEPVGTGPFKFVRWDRNQQIVLERNPDHWREGRPFVDELIFKTIPDGSVAALQLRTGDVHLMAATPLGQIGPLQAAGMQFFTTAEGIGNGFYHFHINTRRDPWKGNPTLRQAMSASIDRSVAASSVFGFMIPMNNPVAQNPAWLNPDAVGFVDFDVEVAKQLIADAGYPNGVNVGEMIVCGLGPQYGTLAQVVQQQARAVGFEFTVSILDLGTYVARTLGERAGDFSMALCGLVPKPDEYDLINHPFAKLFIKAQGYIDENPAFFDLLNSTRAIADDAEYRRAIYSLQETIMESQHQVVLGARIMPHAARPEVRDFVAHTQSRMFLRDVWLEN